MGSRRDFIRKAALSSAAVSLTGMTFGKSQLFGNLSANETVNLAIFGCGGRAGGLAQAVALIDNARVTHICDVDAKRVEKFKVHCQKVMGFIPESEEDYRKLLDNKDIDAVIVATPEHWHAPMAISAMQAGKHVYVEKPCSHNPHETELLIAVQKKYGKLCQMGNQQRSSRTSRMAMEDISKGAIGEPFTGKAWYYRNRGSIGKGDVVPVPDNLNWDLWQGPAPREKYRSNIHPYNWHWFRTWGTGEIHNNGTHEIDICRWALGVNYPSNVVSAGGRYHFSDDWEFFDTQTASYEFDEGKLITWEGHSCSNPPPGMSGRGATIHGNKGTIQLTRWNYILYDVHGKEVKTELEGDTGMPKDMTDVVGFDGLTISHMQNFINGIRIGEQLRSPIAEAGISTQLCHFGNLAQDVGGSLLIDPETGKPLQNEKASSIWKRSYEPGWEPKL